MANFENTAQSLDEIFATNEWIAQGIQAYPVNFAPLEDNTPSEYIVTEILPSRTLDIEYGDNAMNSGMFIAQIYVPVGDGTRRVFQIADILNDIIAKKMLNFNVQTSSSRLDLKGQDSDNPSLYRGDFAVEFNSY